jgi:hypothetical protein
MVASLIDRTPNPMNFRGQNLETTSLGQTMSLKVMRV